jgi:hypothetical protein
MLVAAPSCTIMNSTMYGWSGRGIDMSSSSGIISLAVGLILVFGATAALCSAITEGVARYTGLRGEFLLRGLGELLDGSRVTADLGAPEKSYHAVKDLTAGRRAATDAQPDDKQLQDSVLVTEAAQAELVQSMAAGLPFQTIPASAVPCATSALLGSPILCSQWMASQGMTLQPSREPGRLPELFGPARRPWSGEPNQSQRPLRRLLRLWRQFRSLPSNIPAESFAAAVVDLVVPDATAEITMATVRQDVEALPTEMTTLKSSLQALVKNAGDDFGAFRTSVEHWFDHQMDHVSHEYKRHVAMITLAVGAAIVVIFNINTLTIGRYLYSDFAVGSAVNSVAVKSINCPPSTNSQECLDHFQDELSATAEFGMPLGWSIVTDCSLPGARCNWLDKHGIFSRHGESVAEFLLFLIGIGLTILALLPGARFWFGLLSKLTNALDL